MSYAIGPGRDPQDELRRVAAERLGKVLVALDDDDLDVHEQVHAARRRFKQVRGLLRLFRDGLGGTYRAENGWLRDTGRVLSDLRDAQAAVHSFARLAEHLDEAPGEQVSAEQLPAEQIQGLLRALRERRQALVARQHARDRLAWVRERMVACLERSGSWSLKEGGFQAQAGGLERTYQRARAAQAVAYETLDVDDFHEWRKRVKYHRLHMQLLREGWRPLLRARVAELRRLGDLLGEAHDLSRLRAILVREELGAPAAREAILPLIDARRSHLRQEAWPLGSLLFAESAARFVRRLRRYERVAQAQAAGDPAPRVARW